MAQLRGDERPVVRGSYYLYSEDRRY